MRTDRIARRRRAGAAVRAVAAACAALAALLAWSDAVRADWSGGIEGGTAVGDGGGTLLRATLSEDGRPLTHALFADWVRRGGDGDAWRLGYVPRYWFAPRAYGFAETALRGDRAIGIDAEVRAVAGVGARASLAGVTGYAEVGAGAARTDFDDPCADVDPIAGGRCAGAADEDVEVSGLAVLRAGASATLAELVGLSLDADVERRADAAELRAAASASLAVPGGTASVTLRTRRLSRDGADATSVTDAFVGDSFGF